MVDLATKIQFFAALLFPFVCFFLSVLLYLHYLFLFHEGVSLSMSHWVLDRQTFRHHAFELQITVGVRMV